MKLGRLRHAITYEAIQQCHAEKGWGICWLCGQVGITRASYYQWLKRDVPKAEKENEIIAQLIQEYDERFHHILGYRRMTDWINRLNHTHYSRNRIHRLMKELNIHSVIGLLEEKGYSFMDQDDRVLCPFSTVQERMLHIDRKSVV